MDNAEGKEIEQMVRYALITIFHTGQADPRKAATLASCRSDFFTKANYKEVAAMKRWAAYPGRHTTILN